MLFRSHPADEAAGLFRDVRAFIPELRKTNQRVATLEAQLAERDG